MSDPRYSEPVRVSSEPADDRNPRPCKQCGKATNYNFVPYCACRVFTLNDPVHELPAGPGV